MYVRFVTSLIDEVSGKRQGVFACAYELRDSGELPSDRQELLTETLRWFNAHLETPKRFSRRSRTQGAGMAICWFKDSAADCLRRIQTIRQILGEHGIASEMLTCERPGYIVFEDEEQIAAVPFADTRT